MTHRDRFFAVLAGDAPDRTPFFPDVSDWYAGMRTPPGQPRRGGSGRFIGDDDPMHAIAGAMPARYAGWTYLDFYRRFDWGLPVHGYDWFETVYANAEATSAVEGRRRIRRLRCAKGELERVDTLAADGSWAPTTHYVKELSDLEVLRCALEGVRFEPRHERTAAILEAVGDGGVVDIPIMRSPFGKLVHEYMGFDKVVYALHDDRPAVLEFLAFQERIDLELAALAAGSPAEVVILSDHADENLISPPLYEEFCIPHYRKLCGLLHGSGKIVSTHLDGNFRGYFPLLGETGFDLLDGCTPAPMMNYEPEELAAALPEHMSCYCGVPATLLCQHLDDREVLAFARRIIDAFAGRVILNVGDILPPNGSIEQVVRLGDLAAGG